MTLDIAILLAIIAFTIVAFVREWLSMDVIALVCLGLLLVFGLVDSDEAIAGFGNSAVVTVMMMFVLSEGLVQSGLVTKAGYRIADLTGASPLVAAGLLLGLVGVLSAFINNTAAVGVFMPVAIHLARHYRFSPSKLLMPLSYVAVIGGTCTLFGTSTNLLVSSLAETSGSGFTVFEFAKLGSILFAVGFAYIMLVPRRFLASRAILSSLTRKYHLSGYLTELKVPAPSKLVGRTVVEEHLSERFQMNVIEIIRGTEKISANLRETPIEPDDILLVRGGVEEIISFREQFALLLLIDIKLGDGDLSDEHTILAEVQLTPGSGLIDRTLKEIDFRRRYGCFVLALNRTGSYIREKLARVELRQWDTLLVFGPRSRVEALYDMEDFLALGERDLKLNLAPRWWISAVTMAGVVVLAALGAMPILKAAILGAVVLLATRAVTPKQCYRAIDWTVIFLLAAILPLGTAMRGTGLDALIGGRLGQVGADHGPLVMLSVLYLATSLLTSFFSNNATAVLMVPIAFTAAAQLQVDAKPFLMAVAYAASASFMTPIGYQTNAMVFGPGNYRFLDYVKFGAPLNLLFWILATLLIPVFWPF
ncbi:MAG: SLC13 family permease [Acidobacteriota bacterium]|nr:SLC13 family permease [Acidobacteriota bacterium]MDH3522014.1 SLC13 family permease [Acidobacteriota bacterium]